LSQIGEHEKSQRIFELLLKRASKENEIAGFHNQIGWAQLDQKNYQEAKQSFETAIEFEQKTPSPNDTYIARNYSAIALVHRKMGEYSQALLFHKKAIELLRQSLPPDHIDLGLCYNNIANTYDEMKKFSKAIFHHKKDLEIGEKHYPENDPHLVASCYNIGNVDFNVGKYYPGPQGRSVNGGKT
jgi:tetratricopeptide (TPR) repeat protein